MLVCWRRFLLQEWKEEIFQGFAKGGMIRVTLDKAMIGRCSRRTSNNARQRFLIDYVIFISFKRGIVSVD